MWKWRLMTSKQSFHHRREAQSFNIIDYSPSLDERVVKQTFPRLKGPKKKGFRAKLLHFRNRTVYHFSINDIKIHGKSNRNLLLDQHHETRKKRRKIEKNVYESEMRILIRVKSNKTFAFVAGVRWNFEISMSADPGEWEKGWKSKNNVIIHFDLSANAR